MKRRLMMAFLLAVLPAAGSAAPNVASTTGPHGTTVYSTARGGTAVKGGNGHGGVATANGTKAASTRHGQSYYNKNTGTYGYRNSKTQCKGNTNSQGQCVSSK